MSSRHHRAQAVLVAPILALSMLLLGGGCGPSEKPSATPEASEPTAPTPYTADDIRESSRTGRRYEWSLDVPGKPRVVRVLTFVKVNKGGAEVESMTLDATGHMLGEPERSRATWPELRDHAAFPKSSVTVTEETVTVPAGAYPCKVYTLRSGTKVSRFWFANTMPGPPVKLVITEGGTTTESRELVRLTNVE
jgi:hypothetical protein